MHDDILLDRLTKHWPEGGITEEVYKRWYAYPKLVNLCRDFWKSGDEIYDPNEGECWDDKFLGLLKELGELYD